MLKKLLIPILLLVLLSACGKKEEGGVEPLLLVPMTTALEETTEPTENTTEPTTEPTKPPKPTTPATVPTTEPPTEPKEVVPEMTISARDFTGWVTADELNVRFEPDASASWLGSLKKDTEVPVTGTVLMDGVEIGWYRINFNGRSAYVAAKYITREQPVVLTEERILLYKSNGSRSLYIYRGTDSKWYSENRTPFTSQGNGTWTGDGATWYDYDPGTRPTLTDEFIVLYSQDGTTQKKIFRATDGYWYTTDWSSFIDQGNQTWSGEGAIWYEYMPQSPQSTQPSLTGEFVILHSGDGLVNKKVYRATDGSWCTEDGQLFTNVGGGTWRSQGVSWYEY